MALLTDLVSHWKLDEDATEDRLDSHSSNDINDSAFPVPNDTGKIDEAAVFDGSYLQHADNSELSVGDIDFTWAGWVWIDFTIFPSTFVQKGGTFSDFDDDEYEVWYNHGNNRFQFTVGNNTSYATVVADNFGAVSTGTSYFLVCKHDSVGNEISIKVNNGTADTESWTGGSWDSGGIFYVGARSGAANSCLGRVDSLSFWKRLTTDEEDTELYNAGDGLDYDDWDAAVVASLPPFRRHARWFGEQAEKEGRLMGRIYHIPYTGTLTTAGGNSDLLELLPADDKPVKLLGFILAQTSEWGDAAEESLRISVVRMAATVTSGSGGSSVTPVPRDSADTAFGGTAECNNTTVATTSGASTVVDELAWNIRNSPMDFWYREGTEPVVKQGEGLFVRSQDTPTDDITIAMTFIVEELS